MPSTIERGGLFNGDCPYSAGNPSLPMRWSSVGFIHWDYEPDVVARLLPTNLQVDLYGGRAWVGYQFLTVSSPTMTARLPGWLSTRSTFDEARLRVCVIDENGLPGLYHLSVDVSRPSIVRWQRRTLNVAAFNAKTRFRFEEGPLGIVADYHCERSDGTAAKLELQVSATEAATDIDRFLTARWRVLLPTRFWVGSTESRWVVGTHGRWLLRRASALAVDDDALLASALPAPNGPPHALWSPGVDVRLSTPRTAS